MSLLGVLLRHRLRRDRYQLAGWLLGVGLLAYGAATAVAATYGDLAGRASILQLAIANPGILMVRGLPQGPELGAFVFFQIFTFLALLAGLMSTFLAVRHTRAEEESLRAELVAATLAGRHLPGLATLVEGALANLVLGLAVAAGFVLGRLDLAGALISGAAVAAVGLSFLGVGLVAAQVMSTARSANGVGTAAVLLAYGVRGLGDALGTPALDGTHLSAAWPSVLSPIGWAQRSAAFSDNTLAPLLANLALAAACALAVFVLTARRDSGAGLLPSRAGRAGASAGLTGTLTLAWRLQRAVIAAWCAGALVTGLLAGTLGTLVQQAAGSNAVVRTALQGMVAAQGQSIEQLLTAALFSLVGVLAAACATQTVLRLRQEEAAGMAEVILATPVARRRWLADYLLLGGGAIGLVLLTAAGASGLGAWVTGTHPGVFRESVLAAAAQLPAALLYLAALALVYVLWPEITLGAGWTLLGAGAFLGVFGGLVGLPPWLRNLSPFTHTPVIVGGGGDWSGGAWMLVLAVVAGTAALTGMRRRQLTPG